MAIKDKVQDRENLLNTIGVMKYELEGMENQLSALPFYAEYIEKKALLDKMNKALKEADTEISELLSEEQGEVYRGDLHTYRLIESARPSVIITNADSLPEEAYTSALKTKTEIGKLIKAYEEKGEVFPGAEFDKKKTLEII